MSRAFRRMVVVAVAAALLVGLTAAPLSAAKPTKKTYDVTVSPTSVPFVPTGAPAMFTLTYTNTTPGGIASFNSLALTAPAGFVIDYESVDVTTSSGNTSFTVATGLESADIEVTGLYPVSYDEWVELTFNATVAITATTCAGAVGTWLTSAWTGSNTGGNLFELQPPPPTTTVGTLLAPGSSITFDGVTLTNIGTACSPVTLDRNGNLVNVWKPEDPSLEFMVEINAWDPEPADAPVPLARWTEVDTPGGFHDIEWCDGTTGAPAMPGSEVSCLISQSSEIYGPDGDGTSSPDWVPAYEGQLIQVTEVIYLTGDWGAKRG